MILTDANGWSGSIFMNNNANSTVMFGATAPLPIFPLLGFVANPLLGCVAFHMPDVVDGNILPVWNYGATHYYLVNRTSTAALSTLDNQGSNGTCPAILWE